MRDDRVLETEFMDSMVKPFGKMVKVKRKIKYKS
jgi:hypothetical protein